MSFTAFAGGQARLLHRRILAAVTVAVLANTVLGAAPGVAHASFAGTNGKIYYSNGTPGLGTQIFSINPDGTDITQLTDTGNNTGPVASADGTWLAFISDRSGTPQLWTMRADGSGALEVATPIAPVANVRYSVAVTPGGRLIYPDTIGELVSVNPDGSDAMALTSGPNDAEPAVSPDGSRIAFSRDLNDSAQLWIMNADGSDQTQITAYGADGFTGGAYHPSWSPDGMKIAFNEIGYLLVQHINVINPDGTGLTDLTPGNYLHDLAPIWSPDGTKIVYTDRDTGNIYTVEPAGTGATLVTTVDEANLSNWATSWAPKPPALLTPTGLTAATPTNNAPVLTWNAVAGATSYQVWRQDTVAGGAVQVGSSQTADFTDTYTPGVYEYTVVAVGTGGMTSAPSAPLQVAVTNAGSPAARTLTAQGQTETVPVYGTDLLPGLTAGNHTAGSFDFALGYPGGTFAVKRPLTLTFNVGAHRTFITSTSVDWLVIGGPGNSQGTFQGVVTATVDGTTTQGLPFTVTATDGSRTNPGTADSLRLTVYSDSSRTTALYVVTEPASRGKIKIN